MDSDGNKIENAQEAFNFAFIYALNGLNSLSAEVYQNFEKISALPANLCSTLACENCKIVFVPGLNVKIRVKVEKNLVSKRKRRKLLANNVNASSEINKVNLNNSNYIPIKEKQEEKQNLNQNQNQNQKEKLNSNRQRFISYECLVCSNIKNINLDFNSLSKMRNNENAENNNNQNNIKSKKNNNINEQVNTNKSSKQRAKKRKQSSLQSMLNASSNKNNSTSSGLNLFDLMKPQS